MNEMPTLTGSCACGTMRYRVTLDLGKGTSRCNCTGCTKRGWWSAAVPTSEFTLLDGADVIVAERENPYFTGFRCPGCGLLVYRYVTLPEAGGPKVDVNVRTLDDVALDGVLVTWRDGLHDTWEVLGTAPHQAARPS